MKLVELLNVIEQNTRITVLISSDNKWKKDGNTPLFNFEFLRTIYLNQEKYNKMENFFDYEVIGVQVVGMAIGVLEITICQDTEVEVEE